MPKTYRGVILPVRGDKNYAGMYSAYVSGRFVSADTLTGLRYMIRETLRRSTP